LQWNDLLKTEAQGRLRAGLIDGSILSLGSNSELKVIKSDAASQQTSIEVNYGKLRSQVVKVTKPDGKYEVRTPNAVIGVIGTDFYVGYANNQTTVICYEGKVVVTPTGGAKVLKSDNARAGSTNSVILLTGQMIVIGLEIPSGGYQAYSTPAPLMEASMRDTDVPETPATGTQAAAMVYANGQAWINGTAIPKSAAVFPGDMLQTRADSTANLQATGSSVMVLSDSLLTFRETAVEIERGSARVATSRQLAAQAEGVTVKPVSNVWTEFQVTDVNGCVQIAASKGDLTVENDKGTTTVSQGQQQTTCALASSKKKKRRHGGGAATAAGGGIMSSPAAVYGGRRRRVVWVCGCSWEMRRSP
jgi:ferric-dicitrate binding protein FerR (iron transport regulator)